jgi:hypothetical protein
VTARIVAERGARTPGFTDLADLTLATAAVDAAVTRTKLAAETRRPRGHNPFVHDADEDEGARLAQWRRLVGQTQRLPTTRAAAVGVVGWNAIETLQRDRWTGRLLRAAFPTARQGPAAISLA